MEERLKSFIKLELPFGKAGGHVRGLGNKTDDRPIKGSSDSRC